MRGPDVPAPGLLDDDLALRRRLIEFAEERIGARLQRIEIENTLAAARDDLLAVKLGGLEFLRRRVEIPDHQLDLLACRKFKLSRIEFVILDRDLENERLGGMRGHREPRRYRHQRRKGRRQNQSFHAFSAGMKLSLATDNHYYNIRQCAFRRISSASTGFFARPRCAAPPRTSRAAASKPMRGLESTGTASAPASSAAGAIEACASTSTSTSREARSSRAAMPS